METIPSFHQTSQFDQSNLIDSTILLLLLFFTSSIALLIFNYSISISISFFENFITFYYSDQKSPCITVEFVLLSSVAWLLIELTSKVVLISYRSMFILPLILMVLKWPRLLTDGGLKCSNLLYDRSRYVKLLKLRNESLGTAAKRLYDKSVDLRQPNNFVSTKHNNMRQ